MHSFARIVIALCAFLALCSAAGYKPSGPMVIGYWGCNPGEHPSTVPQLELAIEKGYNVIIYAFYLVGADGTIFKDYGSVAPLPKAQIHTDKQFSYLISLFGGQNGAAPTLTMSADAYANAMFRSFQTLHTQFGFDGIDIDLENSWGGTPDVVLCALRTFFKLMHNAGYVVSMAPQTTAVTPEVGSYQASNWNSYAPLMDTSIIDYVDIVAIQLYNNAVPYNDAAKYTETLTKGFQVAGCPSCGGTVTGLVKVPASKLAHGWPSGLGAAPGGCPGLGLGGAGDAGCPYKNALTNVYAASSTLKATAGVMTWAIEWDEVHSWQFINAVNQISWNGVAPPPVAATQKPTATSAPTSKPATAAPTTQPATAAPTTKAATAAPTTKAATAAPATSAPTAKPATTAPVATAAPTAKAATTAPVATAAPTMKAATSAPTQTPTVSTGSCMTWKQTVSSSWTSGCDTVTMYAVTMTASAPLAEFRFTLASAGAITSIWDATNDNGSYRLPSWIYTGGVLPKGQTYTFGYIVVSDKPATISVIGNPCQ